jgi:central kinetochore subunit Mis15/CHL4
MPLSIPTTAPLPSFQTIPASHPSIIKTLRRLSRPSLISLALDWLDERNQENAAPYLVSKDNETEDHGVDTDLYPPSSSLAELREVYTELQARKGGKREVVDRILEGDWRDGISLYQLAMADMQYLYDHPTSQKWTALKIVRLGESQSAKEESTSIPRFHPTTFLQNLGREVLPDIKAHYNLDRHKTLPLDILRIFIIDSPYNTSLALQGHGNKKTTFDASMTFYVAFPIASAHIFVSLTTTTSTTTPNQGSISDNRSLRKLTLEGIPKAFSRPRERYKLQSTSLSTRSLEALCEKRGGGRTNAASGGWGFYAEKGQGDSPLDLNVNTQLPSPDPTVVEEEVKGKATQGIKRKRQDDASVVKQRKLIAKGRFGNTAKPNDKKGIERLDIRLEDPFPAWTSPSKPLFGEVIPEELEPAERGEKKRKGRLSTISLELKKSDNEVDLGDGEWRPDVRVTFHGPHVFAGIRELVEAGIIDGERMPGWITGEEGVSVGVVKDGRIKGWKGSGL